MTVKYLRGNTQIQLIIVSLCAFLLLFSMVILRVFKEEDLHPEIGLNMAIRISSDISSEDNTSLER